MAVECNECPLRKLPIFDDMTESEVDFMSSFKQGEMEVDAGAAVLMEGARSPQLFTVLRGRGLRFKTLPDGRRQIINFVMPGDFLGLQAAVGGQMGHSVEAATPMTLCVFRRADIWELFQSHPSRAYDITWLGATEEHFLGETLASIGQRSAIERIAWGLVQIWERADNLGDYRGRAVPIPGLWAGRSADILDTGMQLP